MTNEPEPNTRHLTQPSECELCNGLNTCCPDGCDLNAPQPSELVEGYEPCPTCRQYSHSIGCDVVAVAFNHFQSMIAHPIRGHPMGDAFDEQTRDAAQVLMAQLAKLQAELVECDTREAGLVADLSADALAREKLQADGDKLAVALERQTDSMAFVLNHMTVPDAWSAKFTEELIEDRQTLTEWKDRA